MYFPFRLGKFSEMVPIKGTGENRERERQKGERERKWDTLQRLRDLRDLSYSGAIKVESRIPCSGVFYSMHFTP